MELIRNILLIADVNEVGELLTFAATGVVGPLFLYSVDGDVKDVVLQVPLEAEH